MNENVINQSINRSVQRVEMDELDEKHFLKARDMTMGDCRQLAIIRSKCLCSVWFQFALFVFN